MLKPKTKKPLVKPRATRSIVITYPDTAGAELLDFFAAGANYDTRKQPGETKNQFLDRMTKDYIRRTVQKGKEEMDTEAARASAVTYVNANIPIT